MLGKLLPVDGFKVNLKKSLTEDYLTSLISLYQPLIGIEATVLYQLLLQEAHRDKDEVHTHHMLMNYLNLPLNVIYRARLKLEGIGLLKTFRSEDKDRNVFLYELYAPFSPQAFFNEMLLSELLMHHLGKSQFDKLQASYAVKQGTVAESQNITAKFNDVYSTIVPTDAVVNPNILLSKDKPQVELTYDFTQLEIALKQQMLPVEKILSDKNRTIFMQLKTLYDLEDYEMEKALTWSLTEENDLDVDQFRAICLDVFRGKDNHKKIKLNDHTTAQTAETKLPKAPVSKDKKSRLIQHMEEVTPKELLEDLSQGETAAIQDLKMISEIMTKQKLPKGVMNVAIHYCMLQSNMQLSRAYLEKIASHWSRLNIQTVREALEIAKAGPQSQGKKKTYNNRYNRTTQKEVIPDWYKKQKAEGKSEKQADNPEAHEEILKMLEKMNDS